MENDTYHKSYSIIMKLYESYKFSAKSQNHSAIAAFSLSSN